MEESIWQYPDAKVSSFVENEVHVWLATLDVPLYQTEFFRRILSPDERQKAERFVFASDKNNYISSRGILRTLIAHYLKTDHASVKFCYTFYGKPFIKDSRLKFNVSHSGNMALFGFTPDEEIGVDIEKVRNNIDVLNLAEHFFSKQEIAQLRSLPEAAKAKAFFDCWTRKEAYIKAEGEGLSIGLDSFSVPVLPRYSENLLPIKNNGSEDSPWMLKTLRTGEEYCGALALRKYYKEIKFWQWSNENELSDAAEPHNPVNLNLTNNLIQRVAI